MDARRFAKHGLWMTLLLVMALAGAACAGGQRSLNQVEQSLEGGGDTSGSDGSAEGQEASGGDTGIVNLTCPEGPVPVKLAIAHEFNFSPNRMTDEYSVNGTTDPNAWCMLTIVGSKVTAEPCNFSYQYNGFIKGEGAMCQITGDGRAGLEITGRCKDGRVYLTLSEYADDEGLTGTMSCPEAPPVDFGTAYPLSQTQVEFGIALGGDTVTASADPDETGQFSYHKSWTLIFPQDVVGP
jgi:hypothetical protein